jgi:hypothetical protein
MSANNKQITRHGSHNVNWSFHENIDGTTTYDAAQLAVLMDIREQLRALNTLLGCRNFVAVPAILREIRANTKPRRKRKAATRSKP